jgi:hypothetical protein
MRALLITLFAAITIFAGFAVYSGFSASAHAGAIAAQQTTANSILDEALGG